MNTFIRSFEWPEHSFLIAYHAIDYIIRISDRYITIRWGRGGGLMDHSLEWIQVKQILSDIVQEKPLIKKYRQPRLKNNPVILSDEHGDPGTEWYILFEKVAGSAGSLKIRIKNLVNKELMYDQTIILCSPQRDLFEKKSIIDKQPHPLIFATKSDIDHILELIWAIDKVQSECYPDFTI